jgi:hypothetical protein
MKTQKYVPSRGETLDLREEFVPYNTKALDSKFRITLGNRLIRLFSKKMAVDSFRIFVGKNGDILLRPTVSIPSNEMWAYANPKVREKLRRGLEEASSGKIEHVKNLDSFLKNL